MPDQAFANPQLAKIYDYLDADRSDLTHYVAIVNEFNAQSVLDVGCGTGTFLCLLAESGIDLTGVDPAEASLNVARQKPGATHVCWHLGDATTLPDLTVDLAVMTGNVAQVFLCDDDWQATLIGIRNALTPSGRFVFETRDPKQRAWEEWNRENSFSKVAVPGLGHVASWVELTNVSLPMVSFRWTYHFSANDTVLTSDSTLRFREKEEIEKSLSQAGFIVQHVRDAPDRPGKEFVFVAGIEN